MRARQCVVRSMGTVACVSLLMSWSASAARGQGQLADAPTKIVGRTELLSRIMDGAVGPDGSFTIADMGNQAIYRYGPDGRLIWKSGRRGQGPGEYQSPDRVAVLFDGSVLVHDLSRAGFTRLNPDGTYRDIVRLDLDIQQIDNIIGLPDGGVAISGVVQATAFESFAIHVFDRGFRHVRSFGPLPPTADARVAELWGAGGLSLTAGGDLLYTRRHPYEFYVYAPTGALKTTIHSRLPLKGTPDEAFRVERTSDVMRTSMNRGVTRISKAIMLGDGRVLSGRIEPDKRSIDVIRPNGETDFAGAPPSGWQWIAARDPVRNILWVIGDDDDVPVIRLVSLAETR